jgi:hypothetical protein
MCIKFENVISAGQSRVIWFDLKLNYDGFKLGCIRYEIKAGNDYCGMVNGPLSGSGYHLPG